ncbi:nucleotide disphospho-sugar-binding domain-containing protein [Clostridium lacusfryxellense]|uniref:nucleotide disphospho-sugar-binding domain-containing protein n=1 Tax=Clostridium lacusfryxellense TaxID=205328 RepID=UPI001C0C889A|nr:nucleotide disphospho-sugar-binding domain-containing protein [Clostridium lacusfryxellense]MBU3113562.1 hypothetical protein [Clostridium lacusfryxellense]
MFGAGKQISDILGLPSICSCAAFGPSETVRRFLSRSKFNMFKTLIKGIPGLIEFKETSKYLEEIYKKCFAAFRGENVKVVLSMGSIVPITAIGEIPENFIVRKYVPQLELLKYVNLFITHGGMNSVSEGLYNNIPLIVIPQFADQPAVAARVKELGAGVL